VSVTDTCTRLFLKFVTKSTTGTGPGLFITKTIIEAYGGKMGKNYPDRKEATFGFSLPLNNQSLKYCVLGRDPNYWDQSIFRILSLNQNKILNQLTRETSNPKQELSSCNLSSKI
jgi:hypothetical protein